MMTVWKVNRDERPRPLLEMIEIEGADGTHASRAASFLDSGWSETAERAVAEYVRLETELTGRHAASLRKLHRLAPGDND